MAKIVSQLERQTLIDCLVERFGVNVSTKQILQYVKEKSLDHPRWLLGNPVYKSGHGKYTFTNKQAVEPISAPVAEPANILPLRQKNLNVEIGNLVPEKEQTYVPFGFYRDLESIILSGNFYPVFITGLSGNGKTTMIEQICAKNQRECVRVNISIETDEDDLIGGNTLVDGNIVYREGPVLLAMKRGAILILDEIDRGSNKLMCMQAVLEGKPYFNKKTGEVIKAKEGFNIIATANTKGRGTEDGKFIAAQILDEAFLERFPITIEQEYPSSTVERKIIINNMKLKSCIDEEFADKLVTWADIIRKTFQEGGIDEIISTRRLVHIIHAFSMFKDRMKAINYCINRFDVESKSAFLDLYSKLDEEKDEEKVGNAAPTIPEPIESNF
jgi:MoxR-like ATPase